VNDVKTSHLPKFLHKKPTQQVQGTIMDELNLYLLSPLEKNPMCKPLGWWRLNMHLYPKLSTVAKKVHAIPATSAASERVFSKARLVMPWNRTRLASDTLQGLMCLRDWLKVDVIEDDDDDLKLELEV
jgi:hypothetical protein